MNNIKNMYKQIAKILFILVVIMLSTTLNYKVQAL